MSGMERVFLNFLDVEVEVAVGSREAEGAFVLLNIAGGKKCMLSLERRFVRGDCDASLGIVDCIIFSSTAAAVAPGAAVSSRWLDGMLWFNNQQNGEITHTDPKRNIGFPCWLTKAVIAYGVRTEEPTPASWSYLLLSS
jgi:hypothetical protein